MDSLDGLGERYINKRFPDDVYHKNYIKVVTDADNQFLITAAVDCEKIIYLQSNFDLEEGASNILVEKLKNLQKYEMHYTMRANSGKKDSQQLIELKDLTRTDLENGLKPEDIYQYIFLFDPSFFRIITPLNFAFFNKYTLEEMIIFPILALLQHSDRLKGFEEVVHSFDRSVVVFKEFKLYQPNEQAKDLPCFLSFPNDPRQPHS